LSEAETACSRFQASEANVRAEPKASSTRISEALQRRLPLVLLAYGWRELGDEAAAQKWLEQAVRGLSPQEAAFSRVYLAVLPLVTAQFADRKVSPTQLTAINAEVTPQLPLLAKSRETLEILRWLVGAQVKAKQMNATSTRILERVAFESLAGATDSNDFNAALQIAQLWRQAGDEARAQSLLQAVYATPNSPKVTRQARAQAFIAMGFVDEGRAKLATLPPSARGVQYLPSPAYWAAKYFPGTFPAWIPQIKAPEQHLQALSEFAKGLTDPIFESPQERELVLSQGGSSSSF
jgi:hypothetical protein